MPTRTLALVPILLPADAPQILHLHYQSYLSGTTMQPFTPSGPISESKFITQHSPYLLHRAPNFIMMKLLSRAPRSSEESITIPSPRGVTPDKHDNLTPAEEEEEGEGEGTLLAYLSLQKPQPLPNPRISDAQIHKNLRREVELMGCETEEMTELSFQMMCKARSLHERFIGEDYESKWWLLDALWVDVEWQMGGVGSKLVEWGVAYAYKCWLAGEHGERRKVGGDEKSEVDVEGIWLLSSSAGEKTYCNAGFEKIAEEKAPNHSAKEGEFVFSWYVRRF